MDYRLPYQVAKVIIDQLDINNLELRDQWIYFLSLIIFLILCVWE